MGGSQHSRRASIDQSSRAWPISISPIIHPCDINHSPLTTPTFNDCSRALDSKLTCWSSGLAMLVVCGCSDVVFLDLDLEVRAGLSQDLRIEVHTIL